MRGFCWRLLKRLGVRRRWRGQRQPPPPPASSKLTRCSFTKAPTVSELDSLGGEADAAKVSSARGTRLSSSALTSTSRRPWSSGCGSEGASVRNAKLSLPLPLTSSHAVGRSSSASMAATCSSTMAEAVLEPSDLASRRSSKCLCRSSSDKARALQQRPEQGKDERERGVERARSSASTLTMAERVARSGTDGRTNLTSAPAGLPPSGLGATAFVRHRDVSIVFLFIVVVASRQR